MLKIVSMYHGYLIQKIVMMFVIGEKQLKIVMNVIKYENE
jgi:hypothetical protein